MAKKYKPVQYNMTLKMGSGPKEALAKIPHVLAVGIGLKETNGENRCINAIPYNQ